MVDAPRRQASGRCVAAGRRRGVAMLLALGAVAVAAIVGSGLLAGLGATVRASGQLAVRDAAVYLAESALVEGLHRLKQPSDAQPDWDGVRGRRVPGLGGTYDVAYTTLDEGLMRITGTGRLVTPAGRTVEHAVSMTVRVDAGRTELRMRHVGLFGRDSLIPRSARFHGNIHVNGTGLNFGAVHGRFSAERMALDFGRADSIEHFAGESPFPDVDVEAYRSYSADGQRGAAMVIDPQELGREGRRLAPSREGNPLGVVFVDGDVALNRDLNVDGGVLVINGDLRLNGRTLRVAGFRGNLSLIVKGRVDFNWTRSRLRIQRGTAYIGGNVSNSWIAPNARLDANEGLIVRGSLPADFRGQFDVRFADVRQRGSQSVSFFGNRGSDDRSVRTIDYHGRPSY